MKNLKEDFLTIYREERGLFWMMVALAGMALVLLIFSLITLSPSSAIVKVGYGDIGSFAGEDLTEMRTAGGYRDGSWGSMFSFTLLTLIIGVMHNLIAVRLYKRRGEATARAFVGVSMMILLGVFIVLVRLLGEG